ncbi:MAG: hypothetical protein CMP61_12565 [Flavobacteriales bacterium]|nr:hypothetical protein [Flavobacteriales bacterium]|tara:strand:+ start:9400 stop:12084 length:2685 start_codon:yes stop_codon:yes gene_type:complete
MQNKVNPHIQFFTDCYKAENNSFYIQDFLNNKIEHKHWEKNEELLNHNLPIIPIPEQYAKKIIASELMYGQEKELLYCSLFLIGNGLGLDGKKQRICSPLLIFKAKCFKKDEFHYVKLDYTSGFFNSQALNAAGSKNGEIDLEQILSKIDLSQPITVGEIGRIVDTIQIEYSNINADDLLLYPQYIEPAKIKTRISNLKNGTFELINAASLAIVSKSKNAREILFELEELCKKGNYSNVINGLINRTKEVPKLDSKPLTTATLSQAQTKCLINANSYTNSVIVGPPGTGKSFTIANIALDQMSKGKSVLIISKTSEAVGVLKQIIKSEFNANNSIIDLSQSLRFIKNRLEKLEWNLLKLEKKKSSSKIKMDINDANDLLNNLASNFTKKSKKEIHWSSKYLNNQKSVFINLKEKWKKLLNNHSIPFWKIIYSIQIVQEQRENYARQYFNALGIEKLLKGRKAYYNSLKFFSKVLSARTGRKRKEYYQNIRISELQATFPIWLSKLSGLSKCLPLDENQFDLVIIDEASQCDIPSCLPALQRAKRAVFVGDPKQLRFISFMPKFKEHSLQEKHNVFADYKGNSILDFAIDSLQESDQIVMLNEHFRCHPSIINFSNEEFYFKGLNVMKLTPSSHQNSKQLFQRINGKRTKAGVNKEEIDYIIEEIKKIIEEEVLLARKMKTKIGIISPFRHQADAIAKVLIDSFTSEEINKHQIRCSTPYSFQGQERDIIFISISLDGDSHGSAFAYMNKEDVFNVCVTRAKHKQVVVYSFDMETLANHHLIKKMYQLELKEDQKWIKPTEEKDAFSKEIIKTLENMKFEIFPRFQFSSLDVDLLVKRNNRFIGIDLIGYPGEMASEFKLERYSMLNRAGFKTYPLPYSYWKLNKENVIDELKRL